jgi:ABC-type transport system substrate-binding protein
MLDGQNNLDSSATLSLPLYKQLAANHSFENWKFPGGDYSYVRFDFSSSPTDNILARKAVIEATNQSQIVNIVDDGEASPEYSPIPTDNWAYDAAAAKAYPKYNLAGAKQLVQQLGGLSFTIVITNSPAQITQYEALQEQWAQAGIQATLDPVSSTALENDIHTHSYQVLGNAWGENQGIDPDAILTQPYIYGNFADGTFNDPAMEHDIEAGRQIATQSERKVWYDKAQQQFDSNLVEDLLPTVNPNIITAKNVHGVVTIGSVAMLQGVWIS